MLRATDIWRTIYGKTLLHDCSLTLTSGRLTAMVGPNGANKSTLLRILSGEDQPSRGQVQLNDQRLQQYDACTLSQVRAVLPQHSTVNFPFIEKAFAYPVRLVHDSGQMIIVPENPLYYSKSIHA